MRCRWIATFLTLLVSISAFAIPAFCADTAKLPPVPCSADSAGTPACSPSRKELREAKAAFSKGLRLQNQNREDEAVEQFEAAAQLEPRNLTYVTARELARQRLVFKHLQAGNNELLQGKQAQSLDDFRAAEQLDPENEFARQRIQDVLAEFAPPAAQQARVVEESPEIRTDPNGSRADFHYRGDSRALLTQVAAAFGIDVQIDDSVVSRPVRFDIENVDFDEAMTAACTVTHAFWTPIAAKEILLAAETIENHHQFDRMAMRTIYIPGVSAPTDLTNVTNVLRNIFDIRFISPHAAASTLTLRAPQKVLDAATEYIRNLDDGRPQVMLEVQIFQIDHTFMRNIGLGIPNQFNLYNIPAAALVGLAGQNIQSLINQLISGGGINQANSQGIAGLLAQLQGQGNSIFSQPLATFGGGLTFEGLSLGTFMAQASLNESWARDLQHATMRVSQGNDATFHLGEKYPIINATFAPIYNTAAIASVIQNNSFQAPFPSFSYEDIGLNIKAKPMVNANSDVNLDLEMQVRALAGQSVNGVPIISNREYKGSITLIDGQPAVVAGAVSRNEVRTLNGIPGLGQIPLLNQVIASNSKEVDEDELMVIVTPHIVRSAAQAEQAEIWLPR